MHPAMTIKFWGVRGSIPSPGPTTMRYGGNTPCVTVELPGKCLVLDAGTGIRLAGKYLAPTDVQIYVLLTHEHWDHIQGFPFFAPIYQKGRRMFTFAVARGAEVLCALVEQMDGAHFPVTQTQIPSIQECVAGDSMGFLHHEGFTIHRHRTNHPGLCFGYRVENNGRAFVFIPDNELHPPGKQWTTMEELADFCRGADVLVHDSQFLPSDMPLKRGWGHSLVGETCELAAAAGVKHLVLFHHDPERTDPEIDALQADSREWMAKHAPNTKVTAGYEGLVIEL
jgi:phosphoribosyl 1,2-cyclic phosphodiesterase